MRPLTRPSLALAFVVALLAVPTIALGAISGAAAPASNTATYQDSTGEDPQAPDITTITVSNDDTGMISFKINVPNRPTYSQDIAAFIDLDTNSGAGDPQAFGADYTIELFRGEIVLFRWDGSDYTLAPYQSTLAYTWANGPTIRIRNTDLDNTKSFGFNAFLVSGIAFDATTGAPDCSACHRDFAPLIGWYSYEVKVTPPTLVTKRFSATPVKPAAGKPFTLRLVAARSDTGATIQNGRVTCIGRVGKARLVAKVARVVGGAATCTWNIPASAKGKAFTGSVALAFEGLRASQAYAGKIR